METILAQTVSDWELIVCDSYSDDGSWEFFQKFKNDPRVQLHQVPREGLYAGWNECLRRARGEYVYFAPSDDTAQPQLLERLLAPLQQMPEVSVAVCDYQTINETGQPLDMPLENSPRLFLGEWMTKPCLRPRLTEFLLHCCFNTIWVTMSAVLFRRSLLEKIGLFRTDRGSQADIEWTLRATLASDVAFVPGRLATWRVHGNQVTPQNHYEAFRALSSARRWRASTPCCTIPVYRFPKSGEASPIGTGNSQKSGSSNTSTASILTAAPRERIHRSSSPIAGTRSVSNPICSSRNSLAALPGARNSARTVSRARKNWSIYFRRHGRHAQRPGKNQRWTKATVNQ